MPTLLAADELPTEAVFGVDHKLLRLPPIRVGCGSPPRDVTDGQYEGVNRSDAIFIPLLVRRQFVLVQLTWPEAGREFILLGLTN
ncbi:MAG: hypothetical protein ACQESR_22385 [Planctomycetota bacterium]